MSTEIVTIGKINYISVKDDSPQRTLHWTFPSDEAWNEAKAFAESRGLKVEKNAGFAPASDNALFTFTKENAA